MGFIISRIYTSRPTVGNDSECGNQGGKDARYGSPRLSSEQGECRGLCLFRYCRIPRRRDDDQRCCVVIPLLVLLLVHRVLSGPLHPHSPLPLRLGLSFSASTAAPLTTSPPVQKIRRMRERDDGKGAQVDGECDSWSETWEPEQMLNSEFRKREEEGRGGGWAGEGEGRITRYERIGCMREAGTRGSRPPVYIRSRGTAPESGCLQGYAPVFYTSRVTTAVAVDRC